MLEILQASLQQYMKHEIPDVQAGFRKGRGTRDQNADICWIIRKASTSASLTMLKPLTVWITKKKKKKILQEMEMPDHLTSLLRNLYPYQEQQLDPNMEQ